MAFHPTSLETPVGVVDRLGWEAPGKPLGIGAGYDAELSVRGGRLSRDESGGKDSEDGGGEHHGEGKGK